jgi:hypothetical protein
MSTQMGESSEAAEGHTSAETDLAGEPGVAGGSGGVQEPSEEQLRAAYEAELSRISSVDMVLQAAASLLNVGAYRLGLTGPGAQSGDGPPRDLEQVRDAIDAVRGLLPVIERRAPAELRPLRDALSQLQMAYAREAQGAPPPQAPGTEQSAPAAAPRQSAPGSPPPAGSSGQPGPAAPGGKTGPGPAESSGRLWVPGR